eukprot:5966336-Prymnesium_polylepis.3
MPCDRCVVSSRVLFYVGCDMYWVLCAARWVLRLRAVICAVFCVLWSERTAPAPLTVASPRRPPSLCHSQPWWAAHRSHRPMGERSRRALRRSSSGPRPTWPA